MIGYYAGVCETERRHARRQAIKRAKSISPPPIAAHGPSVPLRLTEVRRTHLSSTGSRNVVAGPVQLFNIESVKAVAARYGVDISDLNIALET